MTELKVDTVVDLAGTGKPNFTTGITINTAALSTVNTGEYNASGTEPSSPKNGSIWWDTTNEKIFVYVDGEFKETIGVSSAVWYGSRGLMMGGSYPVQNIIDYITIQSTGNATDFGDLDVAREDPTPFSDGTQGFACCGYDGSNNTQSVSYVTVGTTGNAQDFGDMTVVRNYGAGGACDGTRGVVAGNTQTGNVIDYITTATPSNGVDFGDLTVAGRSSAGGNDATRACFGGRDTSSGKINVIDYVTIQTTGNAQDFGDLTYARRGAASVSDTTRICFCTGQGASYSNVIDYITTQTLGNATDFGDASLAGGFQNGGMSDASRGCYTISNGGSYSNTIEYITIQTTGNATDFGDRTHNKYNVGSCAGT